MKAQMESLLNTANKHDEEAAHFAEVAQAHAQEGTVTVCFWSNSTDESDGDVVQLNMPVCYIIKAAEMWNHDRGLVRSAYQVVVNNVTGK